MRWREFLVLGVVVLSGTGVASAAGIITIDKEPPQLIELRRAHEAEMKNAVTPEEVARAEEEYAQARKNALQDEGYRQKAAVLEEARRKELEAVEARYRKEKEALETASRKAVEEKYEKKLADLKSRVGQGGNSAYLARLEKLEQELVAKNDLAGALVVQTERRKIADPGAVSVPAAPTPKPAAESQAPAAATAGWMAKDNQVHVNSTRGLAGAEGNTVNNVYTFNLERIGNNASLRFYGFGNRSGNSYGKVYLLGPDGSRSEVAEWKPALLQGPKFSEVKSYADVQPVTADLSGKVTSAGQYRIEFKYTDGDEPLNIYRVELKTW